MQISITWCTEDVQSIRPDLSEEQANRVLMYAKDCHDANVGGINWGVLQVVADQLFPQKEYDNE
jgi:hypothetical protein